MPELPEHMRRTPRCNLPFHILRWPSCAKVSCSDRGTLLWAGKILLYRDLPSAQKLVEVGREVLISKFEKDPLQAQKSLPPDEFVEKSRLAREEYRRESNYEVSTAWVQVLKEAGTNRRSFNSPFGILRLTLLHTQHLHRR
jgi:hypothetical protein